MVRNICTGVVMLCALFLGVSQLFAGDIGTYKFLMKDLSVNQGTLVSLEHDTLTIRSESGETSTVEVSNIKKAFNSTGDSVPTSLLKNLVPPKSTKVAPVDDGTDDEDAPPSHVHHRKAYRAPAPNLIPASSRETGRIMAWTGACLAVAGAVITVYAVNSQGGSTSTQNGSGGVAEGYIMEPAGVALVGTGVAMGLAGLIIRNTAPKPVPVVGLKDGHFDLNAPQLALGNRRDLKTTLFSASF